MPEPRADDVAVVIPSYDSFRFLTAAIDSARANGCGQIIVVDDASTDPTATDQLDDLEADGITVVRLLENGSHLQAIGAAIDDIDRPIVALLDADDRMAEGWAATVAATFAEHPDVVQVSGRSRLIDGDGAPIAGRSGLLARLPSIQPRMASGDVVPRLLRHNWYEVATSSGLAFRTDILRRACAHLPDERGWFDTWVTAAMPFHGSVLGLDDVAFDYRIHDANVLGGSGNLELFMESRRRRAGWVDEWAARTGRSGRVDLAGDGRLVAERFAAGESVSARDRARAVAAALDEATDQPPAAALALVIDRLARVSSRSLGQRIAVQGLGRALLGLVPRPTRRRRG